MSRLRTSLEFARHLLRRIPVVVREGRLPRHPRDLVAKLRLAFQDVAIRTGEPALEPDRLPTPGPRTPGARRLLPRRGWFPARAPPGGPPRPLPVRLGARYTPATLAMRRLG